ncbi:MAG: peptidoglycan recognition family protein [Novosphingobium sp.]
MGRTYRQQGVTPFGWISEAEALEAELFFEELVGRPTADRQAGVGDRYIFPGDHIFGESGDRAEFTSRELRARRKELVGRVRASDLDWIRIPLSGGHSIEVCAPVRKSNLYVPVTAGETYRLARRFGVFPLSRAVFDQAHNARQMGAKPKSPSNLLDFITYSQRMRESFGDYYGVTILSGAHKLWVVSSLGTIVNYGFHRRPIAGEPFRGGRYLDRNRFNVVQGLGTWHANQPGHWDYSQMLQFMKNLRDPNGRSMDLRQSLLDGHPAVWDEPRKPSPSQLPAEDAPESIERTPPPAWLNIAERIPVTYHRPQPPMASTILGVVVHTTNHTAGAETIQRFQRDWQALQHQSAHFVIDREGNIGQCRSTRQVAWHIKAPSVRYFGIEHIAKPRQALTAAQIEKSARLIGDLAVMFSFPTVRLPRAGAKGIGIHVDFNYTGCGQDAFWTGRTHAESDTLRTLIQRAGDYARLGF